MGARATVTRSMPKASGPALQGPAAVRPFAAEGQRAQRPRAWHGPASHLGNLPIRAKLTVSQPSDPDEQQADRIADHVMKAPDPRVPTSPPEPVAPIPVVRRTADLQRACESCSHEDDDPQALHRREASATVPSVSPAVERHVASLPHKGQALSALQRDFYEPRFGVDFANVRVHTDGAAAESAQSIRALAYTVGNHIVFGSGQYEPDTSRGKRLIAHELAHVAQARGGESLRREEAPAPAQADSPTGTGAEAPAAAEKSGSAIILPGTIEVPPERSRRTLGLRPASATASGSNEQAVVARKPAEAPITGSPESEAAAEAPFPTGMAPREVAGQLGLGEGLDASVRRSMETRYGESLEHVRVHTDGAAASLCERFSARAFAWGSHIAFRPGAYAPETTSGQHLLRHEVSHVLRSTAASGAIYRAAVCPTTCPPGTAPPFVPVADPAFNCYAYAMASPGSGFLQPGQSAGTAQFLLQDATTANEFATPAQLAAILPYFSPAGVRANTIADLGAPLAADCTNCCPPTKRKVIEVTTPAATGFVMGVAGGAFAGWVPVVSAGQEWDFHWYRKNADHSWSHKRGSLPAEQDDAAGTTPICNPCNASRAYGSTNYSHVVGSWCVA